MNNLDNIKIEDMIYEIRGVEVMLDSDLAKLYHCKNGTKEINQAVKRNLNRFPQDFYFQLTDSEKEILRSQIVTTNAKTRVNPYVFTEQGVAMLATVLHTEIASETSIKIMRSFVKMRHYINYNKDILPRKFMLLEEKVDSNTKRIDELFDKFSSKDILKNSIFFEGEFYDAYSTFLDILNSSKEEIIIIDNYASKELLDILKNISRKIIIVSKNIDEILKKKYESQYNNVSFIYNNSIHDRFIIIDRKVLYTSGSSFKDIGKKCFYIGKIENIENLNRLLSEINL